MNASIPLLRWLIQKGRVPILVVTLCAAGLIIWQVALYSESRMMSSLRQTGEARVTLYTSTLRGALEKFRHLPYVISRDSRILDLLAGKIAPIKVNPHLDDFARSAGAAALFVMDLEGEVIASSNWRSSQSFIGSNFNFRPYFKEAAAGRSGGYFAVGVKTRLPGYYISYPAQRSGRVMGVVVVKVDLEPLQNTWAEGGENVIVSDAYGVLFLSSRSDWKYKALRILPKHTANRLREQQYLEQKLGPLSVERDATDEGTILTLQGLRYLESSRQLPDYGWRIHYLTDLKVVVKKVNQDVIIATVLAFLLLLNILYFRERRLKLLSRQEAREALAVKQMNERLQEEIAERKRTEQDLRETQDGLIQAGKLAALGRMSAAIAHELNQPLAAIRTFAASCKVFVERREMPQVLDNLDLISSLTERMANITGQLKVFARKSSREPETVDLIKMVDQVLIFITPQITNAGVKLEKQLPERGSALVRGDEIRLEQVLVNLIQNALDVMQGCEQRVLRIALVVEEGDMLLSISDTGHGIDLENMDHLFEPFFTTKEVGEGLGLGLSISYGIIQDMNGSIQAANRPTGGACFIIRLPVSFE